MLIRPVKPSDAPGIVQLIDAVYREHGDQVCLENADRDLLAIQETYLQPGGAFVVLADDRHTVWGTHAVLPLGDRPGVCTFRRLYLAAQIRGQGWGWRLMKWAVDWAQAQDLHRVEFWSDVRFTRAHSFFEQIGLRRDGRIRSMTDGHQPYREYFFWGQLGQLTLDRAPD